MPEKTDCYLCGHPAGEPLFWSRDLLHATEGRFGWHRCPNCALLYLNPRPTAAEMSRYYPPDYALFSSTTRRRRWWQPSLWMQRRDINRRCQAAMRVCSRGRILDVGCGTGEFLAAMKQRGWDVIGLEPSAIAAAHAREALGLDVRAETLKDADLPEASFDVITLWTVLEHVYAPLSTLRAARRLLRPGGLLLISIPDTQSLDARCFGEHWVGYDTPRHLYVYPRAVLRSLLEQSGLQLEQTEHFQADLYTFLVSLQPWLRARLKHKRLLALLDRLLTFPGMRLWTWPLFWAINAIGKGCIITIYARPTR